MYRLNNVSLGIPRSAATSIFEKLSKLLSGWGHGLSVTVRLEVTKEMDK